MSGIDECLLDAMALPGARGAALVEWISGLSLGQLGDVPDGGHEAAAAGTAEFARLAVELPAFVPPESTGVADAAAVAPESGKGLPVEDIVVVTRTGYHLLRFVEAPFDGEVFLHLWLDRAQANLALALHRIRELAERLVLV